jgi:8-oxo-dGTP diphosphatase
VPCLLRQASRSLRRPKNHDDEYRFLGVLRHEACFNVAGIEGPPDAARVGGEALVAVPGTTKGAEGDGRWEPPGGIVELDETIEDAVRREVEEETGARVEVERLTGVYKNMARGIVALVFRCRLLSTPVAQSDEARRVEWQDLERIPELMDSAYAVRVVDAQDHVTSARAHDGVSLTTSSRAPSHKSEGQDGATAEAP